METKKPYYFVVDCSDRRNIFVYDTLKSLGYEVAAFEDFIPTKNKIDSIKFVYLFAPSLIIDTGLVGNIAKKSIVFCTRLDDDTKLDLYKRGIRVLYYFDDEELVIKNAKLTAEGAIAHIIFNTSLSLENMCVAVLGGGRIAKFMAQYLKLLDAQVYVAMRNRLEFDKIKDYCHKVLDFSEYDNLWGKFDCIINTVPSLLLSGDRLKELKKGCFVLDLASKPSGVDFDIAKSLGINAKLELGVPGKLAPETAAKFITKSVLQRL